MQAVEPLTYGHTYHIFNRGINGTDLFRDKRDYEYFLMSYIKYIEPIADTYAWVLLKNHFHLLVRIKEENEIPFLRSRSAIDKSDTEYLTESDPAGICRTPAGRPGDDPAGREAAGGVESKEAVDLRKPVPHRQFSHLFNAYSRYFNIKYDRHGSLFEKSFRRIRVDCEKYFRRLVYYIHRNPVKHGFAEHILDWGWSSYLTIISVKPTRLCRETVLGYFDDAANFKAYHEKDHDLGDMNQLLLEA